MPRDDRASILVVDDNPSKLLALEAVLAPLGHRIVCADSGRTALRRLLSEDFAVILLDVRMGDMDGFETAALIRERSRSEKTPIIFVTALSQAEADMERGYALGAVDFVFSPITPEALRNKVGVFVDLYNKTEEIKRQSDRLRRLEMIEHRRRLQKAESGRLQAEARFATMLDIAGDAILAVDEAGGIVLFNKAAERTFERTAEDTIGRSLDELVIGGLNGVLPRQASEAAAGGSRHEVDCRRRDGGLFPAEVSVARTPAGNRALYTVILRDMTERREAEEQVRRLNAALDERLRVGIEMVANLAATLDPREVLGRLLVRAANTVGAKLGTLLRIDPVRMVIEESHELETSGRFNRRVKLAQQPLLIQALHERQPIIAAPFEPATLPALIGSWRSSPLQLAVVPLLAGEQVAVLLLGRTSSAPFSADDMEMLQVISNVAAAALRNAELFLQAEESSRSKSDFLNLAAHELRTPLTVVRGYVSMLCDGSLGGAPTSWERPLEVLDVKLSELNSLINDLLTAARAEANVISAEPIALDLREAVSAAIDRALPGAELATGRLIAELPAEPSVVDADPEHVARILDNLINNAMTYSKGPPIVRVTVTADPPRVTVFDNGVGIASELRERIFERFFRITEGDLDPRPGTGLGLYISRSLAERQGANLRLEWSRPGRGSAFVLAFPQASLRSEESDGAAPSPLRAATPDSDATEAARTA